jgi:integrase
MIEEHTMKIDPYNHKGKYLNWKAKVKDGIPGISQVNSETILRYISDMENGLNISSKSVKGPRSFIRLNNLKQRLVFLAKQFELHSQAVLTELTEEQIFTFFNGMRNGTIKRRDGKTYQSVVDYISPFKAFWHWHMKIHKKKGIDVIDITQDLDISRTKPKWVYLAEDDVRKLCDHALPHYRVLILFLYDSGIRSPTELINVRVQDLSEDFKKLHIREEIAKKGSFGRKINLMGSLNNSVSTLNIV